MPKFKAGDIVHLKSGGPNMTLEVVLPKQKNVPNYIGYICIWFKDDCSLERAEFSEETLQKETE